MTRVLGEPEKRGGAGGATLPCVYGGDPERKGQGSQDWLSGVERQNTRGERSPGQHCRELLRSPSLQGLQLRMSGKMSTISPRG